MKATKHSRTRIAPAESNLCQFPFADGRRCRMLRQKSHPTLCVVHAREEQQLAEADEIAEELETDSGHFTTHTDMNNVIGKLFKLVAAGRIPPRRAQNLAYLAQLLLLTQKGVRNEAVSAALYKDFYAETKPAKPGPPPRWRTGPAPAQAQAPAAAATQVPPAAPQPPGQTSSANANRAATSGDREVAPAPTGPNAGALTKCN